MVIVDHSMVSPHLVYQNNIRFHNTPKRGGKKNSIKGMEEGGRGSKTELVSWQGSGEAQ